MNPVFPIGYKLCFLNGIFFVTVSSSGRAWGMAQQKWAAVFLEICWINLQWPLQSFGVV
jgi:hypothetical protein